MAAKKRRANYGISDEQYDEMLDRQEGKCAICKLPPDPNARQGLGVDHSHVTGAVRGLLCSTCNVALGMLNDDAALIRVAATYLEERA